MKKLTALLLALCLTLCSVLAFAEQESDLERARKMIFQSYKAAQRGVPDVTSEDYQVLGFVQGGNTQFTVEWSVDNDAVKLVPDEDGVFITVDVDERSETEVPYVLTATLRDEAGNVETVSFDRVVPVSMSLYGLTEPEIVAKAYRLEKDAYLPSPTVLTGTISSIDTAYDEQYGNVTVTITVAGAEDKPIQCYRLAGEGAATLAVGDTITVAGKIKRYKDTFEFDSGCQLIPAEAAAAVRTVYDAFTLKDGEAMETPATLTGVITKAEEYSEQYHNVNVYFVPDYVAADYELECFRLAGEGADNLAAGDTITVSGTIKNYKGTIEFDSGCTLDAVVKAQ